MPAFEDITSLGYLQNIRRPNEAAIAGGFKAELGCARALFELRWDLNLLI